MNIQAREGVRHRANCILDKLAQHKCATFFCSAITSGQSSNRSAHPHRSHRTLGDGSFGAHLSQALRARSPSQTTAHPKPCTCPTNRCDRDVGLAESGYDHAVPPGHFVGSSHAATCPRHRANHISDHTYALIEPNYGESLPARASRDAPGGPAPPRRRVRGETASERRLTQRDRPPAA